MRLRRAVFFDRDGTLMRDVHYCGDPAKVEVYPGVSGALRKLKMAGFATVIVSNQSGIGRGWITEAQYRAVEREFLHQAGAGLIDATYFCPDAPDSPSTRRKPEPGMLLDAAKDLGLDLALSWMVGDKSSDIECGRRAGARTILVLTGYGAQQSCQPDYTVEGAVEAVSIVLR
jgi:D-glycero-D-manno-heptose 1,7-bisphosphate phosphatase